MNNTKNDTLQKIGSILGEGRVELNKSLFPFLTLRTRTFAEYYFEAHTRNDLVNAVKAGENAGIKLTIIGGGSNLFVTSEVLMGLTVRNLYIKKQIIADNNKTVDMQVSSGYPVNLLVNETVSDGYEGIEYHKGLPGTVGGALYMNSKWTKPLRYFGDYIVSANLIIKSGKLHKVDKKYFQFGYGHSRLQDTHEVVADVVFRFNKIESKILEDRAKSALNYRMQTQPQGTATCGCFFRNITNQDKERLGLPTASVGYLIDKSGLIGLRRGAFIISGKHANFIVNEGKSAANPTDLINLLKIIKQKVREKWGVDLEEEVKIM